MNDHFRMLLQQPLELSEKLPKNLNVLSGSYHATDYVRPRYDNSCCYISKSSYLLITTTTNTTTAATTTPTLVLLLLFESSETLNSRASGLSSTISCSSPGGLIVTCNKALKGFYIGYYKASLTKGC